MRILVTGARGKTDREVVTRLSIAAAGTGALFVVASATALGQVALHEAGIVSTFHEFGASIGAAVVVGV